MEEDCECVELMFPDPDIRAESLEELVHKLNEDVAPHGYALVVQYKNKSSYKLTHYDRAVIACDRHGKPRNTHGLTNDTRKRKNRSSKKIDYNFALSAVMDSESKD